MTDEGGGILDRGSQMVSLMRKNVGAEPWGCEPCRPLGVSVQLQEVASTEDLMWRVAWRAEEEQVAGVRLARKTGILNDKNKN